MASTTSNRREQLRRQQEAEQRQKRINRIIGIVAGVVAAVLVTVFVIVLVNQSGSSSAQITPKAANAAGNALVHTKGRDGTPTVTLYLDYQCPNCRSFEQSYGPILESTAKAGDWTLEYKTMTFMDKNLSNTASTRAALAAACSADAGVYGDYHTSIYDNQELSEVRGSVGYSDELLRVTLPTKAGLSGEALTAFQSCYDGKATSNFVAAVDKSAYGDGVTGTPTLAVNGKVLKLNELTDQTPEGLKKFILSKA